MRTKEELPECPVATAVSLIGGKWKLLLLRNLKERPWRFNELQRSIDGISQKVLTESLRQMIDDGLAYRRDYHENPPKVEYGLTDLGTEMLPIVKMHLQTLAITINQSLIGHDRCPLKSSPAVDNIPPRKHVQNPEPFQGQWLKKKGSGFLFDGKPCGARGFFLSSGISCHAVLGGGS